MTKGVFSTTKNAPFLTEIKATRNSSGYMFGQIFYIALLL